jgi:hypothetical protein
MRRIDDVVLRSRRVAGWFGTLSAAAVLISTLGCSASGPAFKRVAQLPQGKALVYIYRAPAVAGSGVSYIVRADGKDIVDLEAGGYFPYLADPGEIEFSAQTEASAEATEDLREGKTYYLKGDIGLGFFVGHPQLSFVDGAQGEKEVAECVLLDPEP